MSTDEENNPHVTRAFCDERTKHTVELINNKLKNIVRDINDIKENNRAWKSWTLGIASSIITGVVLYGLTQAA